MELRTLRYFLTVANEKNITRAAEALHVTQPTLSRQLSDLERELGVILFIRGKRSLTLTEDGLLFRQRAEDILNMIALTEHEFAGRKSTVGGVITLGATEAVGGRLLARAMTEFSRRYPGVRFELYNEMADNIQDRIDKGIIDMGLLLEPIDTAKYECLYLAQKETWGVLVRDDHPFAQQSAVDVKELVREPLMLPGRPSVRSELMRLFGCSERRLNILVSYNLLSNVALLVEQGMGVAVCLGGALSVGCSPRLRFVPLEPEHTTRSVLLWKHERRLSPATMLFIELLRSFI